jgi:undecaprenyl-diphosphatase
MNKLLLPFLASLLIWIMFAGVFVLWIVDGRIKREVALRALMTSIIAWITVQMVKNLFPTMRPFETNGNSTMVVWNPSDGSFPSTHTAVAFGIAMTVWLYDKKLGAVFMVTAFLVGAARVAANVHYPLDIAGGAILGALVAYLVERLHPSKLLRRAKR